MLKSQERKSSGEAITAKDFQIPASIDTSQITVVKRSGAIVPFRKDRIAKALELAFRDTKKVGREAPLSKELETIIQDITAQVSFEAATHAAKKAILTVEGIQDIVELKLMQNGHHDIARDYIIYRDDHKKLREDSPTNIKVLRSDGSTLVRFNPMKIASSLEEAFSHAHKVDGPLSEELLEQVNRLTNQIVEATLELNHSGALITTEMIEDLIEQHLMEARLFRVAKSFILARVQAPLEEEKKSVVRELVDQLKARAEHLRFRQFQAVDDAGKTVTVSEDELYGRLTHACLGLESTTRPDILLEEALGQFYEGIKLREIDQSLIYVARTKIEIEPNYSFVAANLLADLVYREAIGVAATDPKFAQTHTAQFKAYIEQGIRVDRVDPRLREFDLDSLARAMVLERDRQFGYIGLQTLYDRYFIHHEERRLETPQYFWMRVAMGLALLEKEREKHAIAFYNILSTFRFVSSTPTLFNAGTCHSQLSSCYLSTVMDDLHGIFKIVADDAQLSKWAGGIGNDWTNVRATGAAIKGTNGKSQGVIPFLKVANDTAVAVNQGGKRKGAMCAYLETWHLDIEDFLELRKNSGDERRRTHDMNTANWVPDLFMKRVVDNGQWTLFSPSDVPDLHDLYGKKFEQRYTEYEKMVDEGKLKLYKRVDAVDLWRKMLGMLFETGHPWITFKDPSNVRSPQDHTGVVHSSNLCTEILLNTSKDETAVCNLGSVNLAVHTTKNGLNKELLAETVKTAIRMLDNVIDVNFYPIVEAQNANLRHRPIGLGIMAFQDALYLQNFPYASHEAVRFADESMELISYNAILGSAELAKERGPYPSYKGSKWDRGLLPIDTVDLLRQERGGNVEMDTSAKLDWKPVRDAIKKWGMRNSNTMAIAPTATIANITNVTQSIEPAYKNLFAKSNLSGEFTTINSFLVDALKAEKLWDAEMIDDLKYFDGSIQEIPRVPDHIKALFVTAFEIEPEWIIECASRRQKWIDMGQSLNLYMQEPSGKKLHNMYVLAWTKGLKTTYYLRSLGATQIEKSTTDINKRGLQPRWMKSKSASSDIVVERGQACTLGENCESCQ